MTRSGLITAASHHTNAVPLSTSRVIEASALYRESMRPVSENGDDFSSISSSAPSVPSYDALRRTHLVSAVLSPLLLIATGIVLGLVWRAVLWRELGLGILGLASAEAIRQPLARLTPLGLADPGSRTRSLLALAPLVSSAFIVEAIRLFVLSVCVSLEGSERPLRQAVWLGLGAAAAEVALRTSELFRQVHFYEDVLEHRSGAMTVGELDDVSEHEEEIVEAHLRARERVAILDAYGVPLDRIPAILLVLWSINSVLLSIGLSALLYLGFLSPTPIGALDPPLGVTYFVVSTIHGLLSALWILLLPASGLAIASFASFVVLFLLDLVVLALWGALR